MSTSHGGVLYYVVQVPKDERWSTTTSVGLLEDRRIVTSTPTPKQSSTDSGWDNPFRPDGDLSREADEIVELIKGGKPITPTPGSAPPPEKTQTAPPAANGAAPTHTPVTASATKPTAKSPAGAVELQRATVSPSDASQVEHVVLKKKPKCKCCVIQ